MENTMIRAVERFLQNGFTFIELPGYENFIPQNNGLFKRLISDHSIPPLCFDDNGIPQHPDDPTTNLGIIVRNGSVKTDNTRYDRKVYFHYAGGEILEKALRRFNSRFFNQHSSVFPFYNQFYRWCQGIIVNFANEFDEQTGEFINLAAKVGIDEDRLRNIAYTNSCDIDTDLLAQPHFDKSGLSLILEESLEGLELFTNDKWIPIVLRPGYGLLLAGLKLEQITNGKIKAIRHQVRKRGTDDIQPYLRTSAVFLAHLDGVELRLKTH